MRVKNNYGVPSAVTILPGIELRFYSVENLHQIVTTNASSGLSDQAMDNLANLVFLKDHQAIVAAGIGFPIISGGPPQLIVNKLALIMLTDLAKEGVIEMIPMLTINTNSFEQISELKRCANILESCLDRGLAQLRVGSKNTEIRRKRIMSGQWCPLCGPGKGDLKIRADETQIYCARKKCGFFVEVTNHQISQFKAGTLKADGLKAIRDMDL